MKITIEHYTQLRDGLFNYLRNHPDLDVKALSQTVGGRWQTYWASKAAFSNAQEFHYLNDENIDTALRNIFKSYLNGG